MARNDVFLNINALSPADAVVTGQQDMTAATVPELVLGDTPTFNFYFTDNTNVWPSWAGNASYTLTWALSDAVAGDFAPAATTGNATPITGGWSVILPLNSYDLVGLLNTKRVGQPYPVQNLWQQLRVTDPSGNEVTRAMFWTPVRYRAISDTQNTESASPTGGRFVAVNNVNALTTPTAAQFYAANPVPTSALGTAANGELLIGNGTGFTKATLTAGSGVSITNGSGSITITATDGDITLDDGTAAAPSLKFTADTDTGLFRPSDNVVGISAGGVSRATFGATSAINGTTIPGSKTLVVTTDKLSALAATTSAELAGVISDETGSGALVFANTPTLVTPNIGAAIGTSVNLSGAGTFGGNLTVSGTGTSSFAGPVTGTSSVNDYRWTLTGSGFGGPFLELNATNATNSNRFTGFVLSNNSTTQWVAQLRAGDGKFHIYDAVRSVSALTVDVGPLSGVAGTTTVGGNLTVSGSANLTSSSLNSFIYDGTGWVWTSTGTGGGTVKGGIYTAGGQLFITANSSLATNRFSLNSSGDATVAGNLTVSGRTYITGARSDNSNLSLNLSATIPGISINCTSAGASRNFAITNNYSGAGLLEILGSSTALALPNNPLLAVTATGNLLLGTTTDTGYKLVVKGSSNDQMQVDAASGSRYTSLYWSNAGTNKATAFFDNTNTEFVVGTLTAGHQMVLRSGGNTTALTLDSSQRAQFAGNIGLGAAPLANIGIRNSLPLTASGGSAYVYQSGGTLTTAANNDAIFGMAIDNGYSNTGSYTNATAGHLLLNARSFSGLAFGYGLRIGNITGATSNYAIRTGSGIVSFEDTTASTSTTTGALIVSGGVGVAGAVNVGGAISIGNTVQTAASVASTHKVTVVIGGVTYYLLATNI